MTTTTDKPKLIGAILKITKGEEKYFDRLSDRSEQYLGKLLMACKNLKKTK